MEYLKLLPALLLVAGACGADAPGNGTAATSAPAWRVSGTPVLSIGEADGNPDYQLDQALDAAVLSDGRIAVVNTGSSTVAVYGRDGRFLARVGRRGKGPGEFESPAWVGSGDGDTIIVWDPPLRRLSYFGSDGKLGRLGTLPQAGGTVPEAVGMLADGSFLVSEGPDIMAMLQAGRGMRRDSTTIQRFGPDGRPAGTPGRFPDDERFLQGGGGGFGWSDPPFGRQTFLAAAGRALYVGDSGTGEISVIAPDGTRSRTMKSPHAPWGVSPADVARHGEERLAGVEAVQRRREIEQVLAEAPFPETSPAFGNMLVDSEGNVWVQAYPRPGEAATPWTVLSPDGRTIGQLVLPSALKVYDVGRDYVLGVRLDELDVEHLELFSVARP